MTGRHAGLANWLQGLWYRPRAPLWLLPLSWGYAAVVILRRWLYCAGVLKGTRLTVPVIVVGNLTVGGTGKTPLVLWLAAFLQRSGFHPGIVSRGYGGADGASWRLVTEASDPAQFGDEPVLMARRAVCPVAVARRRADAAAGLAGKGCDVIVADDGLQHYALVRDVEVAVVDGVRRYGNAACLPAGPLREPLARLSDVDLVVCNGVPQTGEYAMDLAGDIAVNLSSGERRPLAAFASGVHGVHGVAGIGHPTRFFTHLRQAGLDVTEHPFPDHHVFQTAELAFADDRPVLMTEKDAVKCASWAEGRLWFVPVDARPDATFGPRLLQLLQEKIRGRQTA